MSVPELSPLDRRREGKPTPPPGAGRAGLDPRAALSSGSAWPRPGHMSPKKQGSGSWATVTHIHSLPDPPYLEHVSSLLAVDVWICFRFGHTFKPVIPSLLGRFSISSGPAASGEQGVCVWSWTRGGCRSSG